MYTVWYSQVPNIIHKEWKYWRGGMSISNLKYKSTGISYLRMHVPDMSECVNSLDMYESLNKIS